MSKHYTKMSWALSALIGSLFVSAPAKALTCKQVLPNVWSIVNQKGIAIGKSGFSKAEHCHWNLKNGTNENLACIFNGKSWQIYNTDLNLAIGLDPAENYYSKENVDACFASVKQQPKSPFVCSWSNKKFGLFDRTTNKKIGTNDSGWSTHEECITYSLNPAGDYLACVAESGATVAHHKTFGFLKQFFNTNECLEFIGQYPKDTFDATDISHERKRAKTIQSKIRCELREKTWFPVNSKGIKLGKFGSVNESTCLVMARTLHGNIFCNWNGKDHSMYNADTGGYIGSEGHANFVELSACHKALTYQKENTPFICAWNGYKYSPYVRSTNLSLGTEKNGWDSLEGCYKDSVSQSTSKSTCAWFDGPFLVNTRGTILGSRFTSLEDCNAFQGLVAEKEKLRSTPKNGVKPSVSLFDSLAAEKISNRHKESPTGITNGAPDEKVGFPWKKCEVAAHNYHLTKSEDNYLVPECRPDTLYSWGGYEKLAWFKENLKDGAKWPGTLPRSLFTVPSAAATFGYGTVPLRIKLKPNVKFYVAGYDDGTCEQFNSETYSNHVYVRMSVLSSGTSFLDFIICSSDVIESWSYGTKEHYDETLRDKKWMTTKHHYQWEGYSKQSGVDDFIDSKIDSESTYNTQFGLEYFNFRLHLFKWFAQQNLGKVHRPAGSVGTEAQHLSTSRPIYFNPSE